MGFSILCVLDEWGAPACEGFEGGDKENLRDELSLEICRSIFLTLFGLATPFASPHIYICYRLFLCLSVTYQTSYGHGLTSPFLSPDLLQLSIYDGFILLFYGWLC